MVTFKLVFKDEHILIYEYYPNGIEENPGIIEVNLDNQTIEVTKIARSDFETKISVKSLKQMRDSINNMRKENGRPELTEKELPIATEPLVYLFYGSHAKNNIAKAVNSGEPLEKGMTAWC